MLLLHQLEAGLSDPGTETVGTDTSCVRPALPASGGLTFQGQARISGDIFNASCVLSGDL